MRVILFVLSAIGFVSIIFLLFSIFTLKNIINPNKDLVKNNYYAVVILSGNPDRASVAAEMYLDKNAEVILVSNEDSTVKNYDTGDLIPVRKIYLNLLLSNNIQLENILFFGNNRSTYDEVKELQKIEAIKNKKILIVTDKYHHYRVRMLLIHFGISQNVDLYPISRSYEVPDKKFIQNIILEYFKIILFYFFDDYDNFISLIHSG